MAGGDPADRPRPPPRQLTLDLGRAPSYDSEDFLESTANARALAAIAAWPDWPRSTLLVVGPSGCGKSHLGAIWAARAQAAIVRPGDPLRAAQSQAMLIEDCDRGGYSEAALFHTLNQAQEDGGWLLLTARTPPSAWGLRTQDVVSRLRLAPCVEILPPDLALMQAVLVKLFADRQVRIEADVVAYAARHSEQSLEAVNRFVAAVDEESLAAGRRITRPLAAVILASLAGEEPLPGDRQGPT